MKKIIEPLNSGDYLINPGYTLITQSKALLAVINEHIGKGFFSDEDEKFTLKYIPYTCLELDNKLSSDYVVKPYLSREGTSAEMSYNGMRLEKDDIVFQNRVNVKPLYAKVYSTIKEYSKYQLPVIGVYIIDDKPSGLFTRMVIL